MAHLSQIEFKHPVPPKYDASCLVGHRQGATALESYAVVPAAGDT
jgi:hypothetical protein